jgi:hypothetical protein
VRPCSSPEEGIRKYAVVATQDKAIPPEAERFEAQRAHAAITEVQSPRAVPAANPQAVVDVIHQANKIFQEEISTRVKVRLELIDGCLAETGLIITPEMIAKPEPANSP